MATYKRNTDSGNKGKVTYNASIVKGIVALAVADVVGVALKKGDKKDKLDLIKIDFDGDDIAVEVTVDILYGYSVSDVAYDIQQSVIHNVESMSKYKVKSVNVNIDSVFFKVDN